MLYEDETRILEALQISRDEYVNALVETDREEEARWRKNHPPPTPEQLAAHEASIKETADRAWTKMSHGEKQQVHAFAVKHGLDRDTRHPIERMIDQACELE